MRSQYWGKEGRVTGENGDFAGTHPTTVSPLAWSNSKGRFEPVLDLQNTESRPEGAGQPRTAHAVFSGQTCTGTSVPPHVTQPVVSTQRVGTQSTSLRACHPSSPLRGPLKPSGPSE